MFFMCNIVRTSDIFFICVSVQLVQSLIGFAISVQNRLPVPTSEQRTIASAAPHEVPAPLAQKRKKPSAMPNLPICSEIQHSERLSLQTYRQIMPVT